MFTLTFFLQELQGGTSWDGKYR